MEGDVDAAKNRNALSCTDEDLKVEREVYSAADIEEYMELYYQDRLKLLGLELVLFQC